MKNFKCLMLLLVVFVVFTANVFAARGVDYNGHGNPVTISNDATGLKIDTGKSIYLGNGSTFLTGAGSMILPGSQTVQSITVNPGSVTITAGRLLVSNGNVDVYGGHINLLNGNQIIHEGHLAVVLGNTELKRLRLKIAGTSNFVDALVGSATARAQVRSWSAGDSVGIGSLYISNAGKIYQKVAAANADADWRLVTATDAD